MTQDFRRIIFELAKKSSLSVCALLFFKNIFWKTPPHSEDPCWNAPHNSSAVIGHWPAFFRSSSHWTQEKIHLMKKFLWWLSKAACFVETLCHSMFNIAALGPRKKFNKRITWTKVRKKILANVISLRLKRKEKRERGLNYIKGERKGGGWGW